MNSKSITVVIINVIVIVLLLWRVKVIDNDKAPILVLFAYPLLIILDLILFGIFKILKKSLAQSFLYAIKFLLILLVPVIIIAFEI